MNHIIEARRAFYEGKVAERRTNPCHLRLTALDEAGPSVTGLTGYASTVGQPYSVRDFLGEYNETIMPGAFAKSLQERDDVRLLVNHEGVPLARTKSGTMTLREDAQGLFVDVPSLDMSSPLAQTVRSAMERGDVDQMSFAFRATRQEWNEDYTERFIREAQLFDVSVVTYPANPGTSVKLRGEDYTHILREGRALTASDVQMLSQALGWVSAVDSIVDEAQAALADHLGVPNPDDDAARSLEAAERRQAQLRAFLRSL